MHTSRDQVNGRAMPCQSQRWQSTHKASAHS